MKALYSLVVACMIASGASAADINLIHVDKVWSAHPVNFALAVSGDSQFVGYYDADRRLTIAHRPLGQSQWTSQRLDVVTGWDSHNYIALALDSSGHLHVMANMHNDPLVYFRTTRTGNVKSLQRVPVMVDIARERRMTYPVFLPYPGERLAFKYRDGGSGNGNEIYNLYDPPTKRWNALLATPLVDGEGKRNAYFVGPVRGPDGWFHLTWVWRESPDAETNHDLSYARSRDLVNWQRSDGTELALPITLATAEIVDPVPVGAGMINNNTAPGFDPEGRPVITYHKFDARGDTQIHLARRESAGWRVEQITDWHGFRWDFRGRGSLDFRITVSGAEPHGADELRVPVIRDGQPLALRVRSRDLHLLEQIPSQPLAARLRPKIAVPGGMQLNTVIDPASGIALAWPTLPPNRDQPRAVIPPPTDLHLVIPVEIPHHRGSEKSLKGGS